MFVTIGNITHYTGDASGAILIMAGNAREADVMEAAQCISRYVCNGDGRMHEANDEFERVYAPKCRLVLPNERKNS